MKMRVKTKAVGIFAILIIALSIVGFSYAAWTDYIQIEGTAQMDDFLVGIEDGSVVTGDCEMTGPLTLSDDELGTEFAYEYGPGTVTITDITGPGVQFDFTGLDPSSGTLVGDDFPVSAKAGGASKTYGSTSTFTTNGDFSMYRSYRLKFTNKDIVDCNVNVAINTGWTIPPPEYAAMWRDTYWQNGWTALAVGETKVVTLYFCSAEVYNAGDEQDFGVYADGTTDVCMWRTDEVSDIKFQVLGTGAGSLIVSAVDYDPKDIGDCTATYVTGTDEIGSTGQTVWHEMTIAVTGAYPSYHQFIKFNLKNAGSVPAHINGLTISDPTGVLIWNDATSSLEFAGEPIINVCMWKYDANVGNPDDYQRPLVCNQIDPGVCEWVWIWIHFKQPAEEGALYNFKIHIDAIQWNEA